MSKEEINEEVSNEIVELILNKPHCVLGLATGSTPIGVYDKLIEKYNKNKVSFKNVTTFNLDEYIGLEINHPQSYHYFMNDHLFSHIDIDVNNVHVPDGIDYEKSAGEYDANIENAGGIDFQILGIGSNGHIAFNEPGTSFNSLTHVVNLKESTIKDNSRFFNSIEEVPTKAISMGLASIMKAKRVVLIATGENKSDAILKLASKEVTTDLPASILVNHPNVTIYADEAAASKLKK